MNNTIILFLHYAGGETTKLELFVSCAGRPIFSNSGDHAEKKPYKCRICDKVLRAKKLLSTIIVAHTEMKYYKYN